MATALVVLVGLGVLAWLVSLGAGTSRPPSAPRPPGRAGNGVAPPTTRRPPVAGAGDRDDGAFVDGYIWGRLEERHDRRTDGHVMDDHDSGYTDDGYDTYLDDGYDD